MKVFRMKLMNIIQQRKLQKILIRLSIILTGYVDDKKDSNITHKDQEVIIGEIQKVSIKLISVCHKGTDKSGEEITNLKV